MSSDKIEQFISKVLSKQCVVKINLKANRSFTGVFISASDFNDLKAKNFWRVVSQSNYEQWNKSKDANLCRLFNGADFTKLYVLA